MRQCRVTMTGVRVAQQVSEAQTEPRRGCDITDYSAILCPQSIADRDFSGSPRTPRPANRPISNSLASSILNRPKRLIAGLLGLTPYSVILCPQVIAPQDLSRSRCGYCAAKSNVTNTLVEVIPKKLIRAGKDAGCPTACAERSRRVSAALRDVGTTDAGPN